MLLIVTTLLTHWTVLDIFGRYLDQSVQAIKIVYLLSDGLTATIILCGLFYVGLQIVNNILLGGRHVNLFTVMMLWKYSSQELTGRKDIVSWTPEKTSMNCRN